MRRLFPSLPAARRPGFTLTELLAVVAIMMSLAAVSLPVLGAIMRDTRLASAVSRLKVGMQQARAILSDYPMADRSATFPRIAGGSYTGTAVVVRWDDVKQDYDIFYALCDQNAVGSGGPADFLASRGTPPGSAPLRGYSPFLDLEPMSLGAGLRVAGLRRNKDKASKLEIVPGSSFAVCMDPTGVALPPDATIYVNLQESPPAGGSGPWSEWDTTMYDAADANTGAHEATYRTDGGKGEGFNTSLATVLIYRDDDLPATGNSPSGTPWRVPGTGGALVLNPDLDPNELLAQTGGRLVMLTLQGGSPMDY